MNFNMPEGLDTRERHTAQITAVSLGVLVAGVVAYNKLKPERSFTAGENYFDIIDNLDDCVLDGAGESVKYVMLGGGASAALMDPRTEVDSTRRLVIPPSDIKKAQYRKDTGTLADVDLMVFSDNEKEIESVRAALIPDQFVINNGSAEKRARELAKPGAKLKIGVTGLKPRSVYLKQPASIAGRSIQMLFKDWVSHRLSLEDGSRAFAISDVMVDLPDEYFEPWHLALKSGNTIPILHPLIQVLCYPSRASHGIRKRDKEKVTKIIGNIGPQFGARLVWGENQQTASLVFDQPVNEGVRAAADFCNQKNALRWETTKTRLGKAQAGLLAARMAVHRQADTKDILVQFGQGGPLYDNVLSHLSGERQSKIGGVNG